MSYIETVVAVVIGNALYDVTLVVVEFLLHLFFDSPAAQGADGEGEE